MIPIMFIAVKYRFTNTKDFDASDLRNKNSDATLLTRNRMYPNTFIPMFDAMSVLPPIAPATTHISRNLFTQYPHSK